MKCNVHFLCGSATGYSQVYQQHRASAQIKKTQLENIPTETTMSNLYMYYNFFILPPELDKRTCYVKILNYLKMVFAESYQCQFASYKPELYLAHASTKAFYVLAISALDCRQLN